MVVASRRRGVGKCFWWKLNGQKPQLSPHNEKVDRVSESPIRLLHPHLLAHLLVPLTTHL